MSNARFREGERLMAATRAEIPGAAVRWLAAVREPLEILTMAAVSPDVSDEQFVELVEAFSESLPGLFGKMDHAALAELMEGGMGAAIANGLTARDQGAGDRGREEKRAKLPWEKDAYLAAQKRRKNGQFGEGDGTGGGERKTKGKTEEMIARYEAGVTVKTPTGRNANFGKDLVKDMRKWKGKDLARAHYAARAEAAVKAPDEIHQHGTLVAYFKKLDSRKTLVIHSQQQGDDKEEVQSFIPMPPRRAEKRKRGQKTWPRP